MLDLLRRAFNWWLAPNSPTASDALELPWATRWQQVPRRTAGADFGREDYRAAREKAREVARATLGDSLWQELEAKGYLEVPSGRFPGVSYRLRVGRRIEVRCRRGTEPPWPFPFLCVNPTYPLPEEEFFAHLYLYVRDREDDVIRVAAPQPWDQPLGRTF